MPTTTLTTYGPGGYDPAKPNGNAVSVANVDVPAEPATADDKVRRLRAALADIDKPGKASNVAQIAAVLAAIRDALAD